ncbi:MAG: flagellar hook-length control protein FliK [Sulfurimonas sp.]|nr:flagellar hook-length control protein FliK [Sulfurimonas sp.]
MINFAVDKKLNIILPSTNKALAEVLKDASPKELEAITKGKDLKSIISSLLKGSSQNPSADKTLLELVKNNPTLKSLGKVNETLKELLSSLKSDKNLQPVEKFIQKFLPNIKELNNTNIKPSLENSGVFLESKIKHVENPQIKLTKHLTDMSNILQKSDIPNTKAINAQIKELMSLPVLKDATNEVFSKNAKENPKVLENLAKNVQDIVKTITSELKQANPITTPVFERKLTNLEQLVGSKNLENENFKLPVLKESIQQVTHTLQNSFTKESKGFLDALNKIFNTIQTIEQNQNTLKTPTTLKTQVVIEELLNKKVPSEIKNIIENVKIAIKNSDPLFSKPALAILNELSLLKSAHKLSPQLHVKEILSNDFKAVLYKASEDVVKLAAPNQSEITKQIDKLVLQIDYHQLVSHLSNASSLYIPFSWQEMEDGNITIKQAEKDKFYCDIELKLKEYGELKLRLTLYDKNQLNIHINSDNEEFKKIIKENIPTLRKALIDTQITPREIRLFNKTKTTAYESNSTDIGMGFEVKV